jgi:hypothetical protein
MQNRSGFGASNGSSGMAGIFFDLCDWKARNLGLVSRILDLVAEELEEMGGFI